MHILYSFFSVKYITCINRFSFWAALIKMSADRAYNSRSQHRWCGERDLIKMLFSLRRPNQCVKCHGEWAAQHRHKSGGRIWIFVLLHYQQPTQRAQCTQSAEPKWRYICIEEGHSNNSNNKRANLIKILICYLSHAHNVVILISCMTF